MRKPALAAINGDFFVIQPGPYQGDPRGIQIAEGELVSAAGQRVLDFRGRQSENGACGVEIESGLARWKH